MKKSFWFFKTILPTYCFEMKLKKNIDITVVYGLIIYTMYNKYVLSSVDSFYSIVLIHSALVFV